MLALIDGDPFFYQAAWGRTLEGARYHWRGQVERTINATFAEDYLIAVGTGSNFRKELFPFYKKSNSRVSSKDTLPDWFDDFKLEFYEDKNVVAAIGMEADDLIRIWAGQAAEAGDPHVVCSLDKDLDAIPGIHFNNKTNTIYEVTQAYSDKFFWKQCLMGDGVDNIPGIPRIGTKTADKWLEPCTTNKQCEKIVVEAYQAYYGDKWWEYFIVNARLLHIWRFNNDFFHINRSEYD